MKLKSIQSLLLVVLSVGLISLTGCASAPQNPYLYTGAGIGGAVGAAIGAGTNGNNPWKGAAIGGLLGGAVGAVGGEVYGRSQQPSQPQQGYYQQPGYGYPPPNQNYNRGQNYGQPYGQSGPPPGYYSQEGTPAPYGASQSGADPSYRYAY
jgi:Glycine zipper